MATLRIRFVATGGPVSNLIRAAQLGWPYTHVDVEVDGAWLGAHAIGGVALRPIGYDSGPRTRERILALEVDDDTAATFRAFCLSQVGKPYDLAAIAEFAALAAGILHEELHDDSSTALMDPGAWRAPTCWFCSELVAAALVAADVLPRDLGYDVRRITPQNLAFALAAINVGQIA